MKRIYLDNAATSWPKPPAVLSAITDYYENVGMSAGRGNSAQAADVVKRINRVRSQAARLMGADESSEIVFTFSGTDSLNIALLGVIRPGDHVITTRIEHNSVLRPLKFLEKTDGVAVTRIDCDRTGFVDPEDVRQAIKSNTRLLAISQASNVTGKLQDLQSLGEICAEQDVLFLVDAAQTLGYVSVDVQQLNCDIFCAPGHKGLLGPLGTGVLYLRLRIHDQIQPFRLGGTGTVSESDDQPTRSPHKFESGNMNAAGILAMGVGMDELQTESQQAKLRRQSTHCQKLVEALSQSDKIDVLGDFVAGQDAPIISLNVANMDCREFATILDASFGIHCRAGFHCAPLIHPLIESSQHGTLRLSPSAETTTEEIEYTIEAIQKISSSL